MKRLRCWLRSWHYLDNMGGLFCCRDCGKLAPDPLLHIDVDGPKARWR